MDKPSPVHNAPQKKEFPAWLIALKNGAGYLLLYLAAQAGAALLFLIIQLVTMLSSGEAFRMRALVARYTASVNASAVALSAVANLLVLLLLFLRFRKRGLDMGKELGLRPIGRKRGTGYLVLLGIALNVFVSRLMALLPARLLDAYADASAPLLNGSGGILLLAVVLLGPLVEEIMFRGLLYGRFRRGMPAWCAALIASAIFGAMHGQWLWMTYAFVLGVLFCFIYERFRSLYAPLILHMTFNFANVFSALTASLNAAAVLTFSGALSALLLYLILRYCGAPEGDPPTTPPQ